MSEKEQYVRIDYFKELTKRAYQENEGFDEFVQRIAERYFPGRGAEWVKHYAFIIHFYGLCVAACQHCDGSCPHHGHRYHLRIKRGTSIPVPYASEEPCPRYCPKEAPKKEPDMEAQQVQAAAFDRGPGYYPGCQRSPREQVLQGFY